MPQTRVAGTRSFGHLSSIRVTSAIACVRDRCRYARTSEIEPRWMGGGDGERRACRRRGARPRSPARNRRDAPDQLSIGAQFETAADADDTPGVAAARARCDAICAGRAALRRARDAAARHDPHLCDGVIVERHYDAGSLVGPGDDPVVVVADLRVMKLEAGVSELEAGRLKVGMPARVTAQARPGEAFDGRLAAIAPEVDARNRHFKIEVRIANPGTSLLRNVWVRTIPLERAARAVAVPRDAVTTRDGRRVALRIDRTSSRKCP